MKKGFTLIELLATIVVIAIIALITIPVISNVITKAKLGALKDSAYGLLDASNLYMAMNDIKENIRFDKNDSEDTLKNLKYKGSIKEGTVILNEKGKITLCITDGENSAYKNYTESNVTLIKGKTCNVPSNSNIVFLNGDRTLEELSNLELTDKVAQLEQTIATLTDKVENGTSLDKVYPIGSIYLSADNINPSTLFGGTWEKIEGKFLLSSDNTFTLGSTGGSTSTQYTPAGTVGNTTLTVNQIPSHSHKMGISSNSGIANGNIAYAYSGATYTVYFNGNSSWGIGNSSATGGSQAHTHTFTGTASNINTMPPYIVVNVWKRVN